MVVFDLVYYYDIEGWFIFFGWLVGYCFVMVFFWGVIVYVDVEFLKLLMWGMVKGIVMRYFWWW